MTRMPTLGRRSDDLANLADGVVTARKEPPRRERSLYEKACAVFLLLLVLVLLTGAAVDTLYGVGTTNDWISQNFWGEKPQKTTVPDNGYDYYGDQEPWHQEGEFNGR